MTVPDKNKPKEKIDTLRSFINYKSGELFIEDVSYLTIMKQYHTETPVFVFSKNRIMDNIKNFSNAFKKAYKKVKFFYPLRANYLPDIVDIIKSEGWGAEVTSSFEYKVAKLVDSHEILLNGFNKKLYSAVINDEKLFYMAIDSLEDAKYLNELGTKLNKVVNIGLRVHPELGPLQTNALTPRGFKLGYDIKSGDAERVIRALLKLSRINILALNTHIANRQLSPDLHAEALQSLMKFADKMHSQYGIDFEYINIGGGFESRNLLEQKGSLDYFANRFSEELSSARKDYTLILEPGRYITCDTAVVLTEVLTQKINTNRRWIIVDVGVNTLIPLKSASFDVIPTMLDATYELFNIGDFVASSMGVIKENIFLPKKTKSGDILAVINAGAYTLSMSEQFGLLRPNVMMVDQEKKKLIKEAEDEEKSIKRLRSQMW